MAFLSVVAYFLLQSWSMRPAMFVGLLLLFAGGMGNLIDRLMNDGRVTDFLVLGIWPIQTGIINVADVVLTAGALTCALLYHRSAAKV
jgi:signal peptidase II